MDWNKFAHEVHQTAVENGLWDKPRSFDEVICECLVHLGRAYEEYRSGRPNYYHLCEPSGEKKLLCDLDLSGFCPISNGSPCEFRDPKPEGAAAELGECVLRLLDYLASKRERIITLEHVDVPDVLGDFPKVICDLHGELIEARYCDRRFLSATAEIHMRLCIENILGWARQNNIDLESILRELHECSKKP